MLMQSLFPIIIIIIIIISVDLGYGTVIDAAITIGIVDKYEHSVNIWWKLLA